MPVQGDAGAVVAHGGARIGVGCGLLHVGQRDAASRAAVMTACRRVWGPTGLVIPSGRATRPTIRPAAWRSKRLASRPVKIGPSNSSPIDRSMARAVRGARGMVMILPRLRVIVGVRRRRARPRGRYRRRSPPTPAGRLRATNDTTSPLWGAGDANRLESIGRYGIGRRSRSTRWRGRRSTS